MVRSKEYSGHIWVEQIALPNGDKRVVRTASNIKEAKEGVARIEKFLADRTRNPDPGFDPKELHNFTRVINGADVTESSRYIGHALDIIEKYRRGRLKPAE